MKPKIPIFCLFSIILFLSVPSKTQEPKFQCNEDNPPIECILFKDYPDINNQLSCQLCAVALEVGKYQQKTDQYCNQNQLKVRNCELTSFAYLVSQGRLSEAFDLEYEIFYFDPFNHDKKVSAILKKQNIRSKLISWLQKNIQNTDQDILLNKAIANIYIDDIRESENQIQEYLIKVNQKLDKRSLKIKCRIYQKQGRFNEALNLVSKYIKVAEADQKQYHLLEPYIYHLHGNLLMHHLKFDQAILEFNKASSMFKAVYQDVTFLRGFRLSKYNIGLCYQKLSKFDESVKVYLDLVKHVEKNAEILNGLGNSYVEWSQQTDQVDTQKLRKGIFYLTRSIDENPNYYIAFYNLGYAYLKLGDVGKAIQSFQSSLKIEKTNQAHYGLLTAYFESGQYQQAEALINLMNINEESIDDLLSIFYQHCHSDQGRDFYEKALIKYEGFIKSAISHYWKGMIQFSQEEYGLAIDHFLKAYDKGYSQPHLLFNLGYSYELIDELQSAVDYYEKAFKKDPRPQTKERIVECKKKIEKQKNQEL